MKKSFIAFFILLSLSSALHSCDNSSKESKTGQTEETVQYQCPMDCEKGKTYEETGSCPMCGMDLEKAPLPS